MEETKEPPVILGGDVENTLHQEDRKSLPNEFEKDEETSHEKEEDYIETILKQILLWTWTKGHLRIDV